MTTVLLDKPRPDDRNSPIILRQKIEAREARFLLQVPDDLEYFRNHFPDHPILPGVVQIKWVMELAGLLPLPARAFDNFTGIKKLKFMRLMMPGHRLSLRLTVESSGKTLVFCYFSEEGEYSSGQLIFK